MSNLNSRPRHRAVMMCLTLFTTLALVAAACGDDAPNADDADAEQSGADDTGSDDTGSDDTGSDDTGSDDGAVETAAPAITEDRAYYILPPGNFGGIPTTDDSLDQLPLYDGLTPLRGDITDQDLDDLFLPEDFEPVGPTTVEETPNDAVEILYDDFGIAHITGETREDMAYGAGWVTARDRELLIQLGRGPARVAVADIPGINAFGLVTSARQFVASEATEQLVTDQVELIRETYGEEGDQIIADAQAYADGMTAYWEATGSDQEPATVNDVIAVTAFIGSIFGAGGGSEATNANFLSTLESALGEEQGRAVWDDVMRTDDPEAPTTIDERFEYGTFTGGDVTGSVPIDAGSIISLDPSDPAEGAAPFVDQNIFYDAAGAPPSRNASNWLLVDPDASVNDTTLAVMGPQLGYYYPEIVQQIHLSAPGIEAQGAAVPGLSMYLLLGRTEDYAWSLTSANQDVRDVFAEVLCNPDGSPATRTSGSYMFDGECIPFEIFDAGTLDGAPISYPISVHGPVIGTALSNGEPIALTRQRSTFGRDGLNLGALKQMTEGAADTPEAFFEAANNFGFTFNWGYANRDSIAYFASGLLPERAEGLDRRLPTLGTGEYEWQGFLDLEEHPHADSHPSGRLLNWNNQSAPGFMHGDGTLYGSNHRVELFDQWSDASALTDVVGVMNRSATEDTLSPVWPVISAVLATGDAPSDLAADVVAIMDEWVANDAPRLDADDDGDHDEAGPLLMDELFGPIADAVMRPVFGDLLDDDGFRLRGIDADDLVDKDLRTLIGDDVEAPYGVAYCGAGDLDTCQADLWAAVDAVATNLAAERGDDPATWLSEGQRTSFQPGLIPDITFRTTNRPTFQQVLEFAPES